jgi:TPP-dependent pyruvate/acetoin dehydrogenase alpha subunit
MVVTQDVTRSGLVVGPDSEADMNEPADELVKRMQELSDESRAEQVKEVVRDVYAAAQKELDDQRAQAEFEREE